MRIPARSHRDPVEFNMTPMIDVVFLLIIFFLVSSHLAKQEAQMELPLPMAESGDAPQTSPTRRITLNVLPSGELIFSGRRITQDELAVRLSTAQQTAEGQIEVRIRSDRNVAYQHIEPLMLACARAGIWDVSFGVLQRGQTN